jgi:DNA-binding transcriptional LysR family regulator
MEFERITMLQIKYFLAVADEMSFVKAAERVYVSQPAISRQVSLLEDTLGVLLLDRTNNKTSLTPAGELLRAFFKKSLTELSDAVKEAQALKGNISGTIRIATQQNWNLSHFRPELIERLHRMYPGVKIEFASMDFREMLYNVKNEKVDMILAMHSIYSHLPGLASQIFTEIQYTLLYSKKLPEAEKEQPEVRDFKNYTFFASNADRSEYYVRTMCKPYGFSPAITVVPNTITAISEMENGSGVFIADSWTREYYPQQYGHMPLHTRDKVGIAWMEKNTNPLIPLVVNELIQCFHVAPSFPT